MRNDPCPTCGSINPKWHAPHCAGDPPTDRHDDDTRDDPDNDGATDD
jgi:hypothetical protein